MIRKYTESEPKSYQDLLSRIQQRATIAATAAVIFMITSLVLFVGLLIVANYPKSQGYVIELTPEGEAVYNPDSVTLLEDWQPKDNTINYFLRTFLTELRTVSSDPQIVQQNIQRLYHQVTGNATDKVTEYIEETDPRSRLKRETVTIAIASILPISDTTYQVESENFRNQFQEIIYLYSLPYNVYRLTLGQNSGLPEWFADWLNRAFSVSHTEVDGVLFTLAANEVLCIPARCPHRYEADRASPWSLVWVHFTGEDCALYPLNPPRVCRLSAPDTAQRVEFLFSVLFDTLQEDYTLGNFIYLSQVLGMILAEIYARTPAPDAQQRLVSRAIRLMAARVDGTLTLPELCSALQRSKSSVSAAFRRCTGRAPMDFFLRLKMQEACRRLCADRRTVSEVARSLGYQDPYYFSRLFKKVIGVGPRAYRDGTSAEEDEPL